jgi:hypothetical protein
MAKSKCLHCSERKGKRACPALDGMICTLCCGQYRLSEIKCPDDCPHLGHEDYQNERREDREIEEAMQSVNPNILGYDPLEVTPEASEFAYNLEHNFASNYLNTRLTDKDIAKALRAVYFSVYKDRPYATSHAFSEFLVTTVRDKLKNEFKRKVPIELQEKIILRLMLSIKNMSGGSMGECGYLNYVKNNILELPPDGHFIQEDKLGNKQLMPNPEK